MTGLREVVFFILLLSQTKQAHAEKFPYEAVVVHAIDGDTVKVEIPSLSKTPMQFIDVRVSGVDTAEKGFRAKCKKEADKGLEATEFAKSVFKTGDKVQVTFDTEHKDKFGRLLSDITLSDGKSYAKLLISKGLAREYHGEAKSSWCR